MFRTVQLSGKTTGALFLHSMPGRYESWSDFLKDAQERRIDGIVCLTGMDEIREKSPDYAAALETGRVPCPRACFPIDDYGVPEDWEAFARFVSEAAVQIRSGKRMLVHCAGGVGRTGTFAVCLLHHFGMGQDEAENAVASVFAGPETPEQEELVSWHVAHARGMD